ncbi:MAG TPA: bacillithiol biosynthesis cysteine-adding enzyme BshC [Bacteroidia bacterium]|nr:bacillithiol biosynthesis cysteine-adding enzyme BshC [Bacteroidia bacterium]
MLKVSHRNLLESGVLNPLVQDYLSGKPELKAFYAYDPSLQGYSKALDAIRELKFDRGLLVQALLKQNEGLEHLSKASRQNIGLLKNPNCFSITTGHQLCLFTGPLYFVYKIMSVIRLCDELKQQFPQNDFVPVYWMASEDHDFEEVNHFHLFGKTFRWESSQKGAVGSFNTTELQDLFGQLKESLGTTAEALELSALFEEAYLKHPDLASATRFLCNALFGEYGLVILDGNDSVLKKQFSAVVLDDCLNHSAYNLVNGSTNRLESMAYQAQVKARAVNSFFLEGDLRTRLEEQDGTFKALHTDKVWNKEELITLAETQAWKFSPNVVLRPLYQQMILPNLAYVGGPGELAYWLQYKSMFDHYKVFFPVLQPRASVTVFDHSVMERLRKLGLEKEELFLSEEAIVKLVLEKSGQQFDLNTEKEKLGLLYGDLAGKISAVDRSLESSVSAELQKSLNGLQQLEGKVMRALKQRSDTEIRQVKGLKQRVSPEGAAQERYENILVYYLRYGRAFLHLLRKELNPLLLKHILLFDEF